MVGGLMIGILDSISSLSSGASANYPVLHLDASEGVNGGSALNGHAVYEWADQSGNGNNFLQGTAIRQPIYDTVGIGGKPSITFDVKRMELSATKMLGSDYTIYCVFKTTTNTTATPFKTVFSFSNGAFLTQGIGRVGMAVDTGYTNFYYDDRVGRTAIIPHDTDAHYFTISNGVVGGTPKKQIYADGVNYIDVVSGIDSSQLEHFIGAFNGQWGNFQIAELIAYSAKHTPTKQNEIELYLKNKYGL